MYRLYIVHLYFIVIINITVTVMIVLRDIKFSSWMLPFLYYIQVSNLFMYVLRNYICVLQLYV